MSRHRSVTWLIVMVATAIEVTVSGVGCAQQRGDPTYNPSVPRPVYERDGPSLRIDEAHHNFHTASGRYRAFAELARKDGYRVSASKVLFGARSLAGCDVMVISNARGADSDMGAAQSAFTDPECDALLAWIRGGGALLLIADHAPMGAAASRLAGRLGVEMRNGATVDPGPDGRSRRPGIIDYTRATGLADHPITRGRDSTERVTVVRTFTGQSLSGPEGSSSFLDLPPTAVDVLVSSLDEVAAAPPEMRRSAAGRSQALAFELGMGRVVVLGEAAMLSAQVAPNGSRMGMNDSGNDNRQLALNILHWLTRKL